MNTLSESQCFQSLVNAFVKQNQIASCLVASAALKQLLHKHGHTSAKMTQGVLFMDTKYACWHAWVITDNNVFDSGTAIAEQQNASFATMTKSLYTEKDFLALKNVTRLDLETEKERKKCQKNKKSFMLFENSPHEYWEQARKANVTAWVIRQQLLA